MPDALPLQRPTMPGLLDGIVALDPPTVQCSGCGHTVTERRLSVAVMCSGMRFHPGDDRRLCKACRVATFTGCDCHGCDADRRQR